MKVRPDRRRGTILILVLVLVPILAFGAYSFTHYMRAESEASNVHLQQTQARWLALSGIERFRALLVEPRDESNPLDLVDNPYEFAAQEVMVDARGNTGMFTLLAPEEDGTDSNVRYGVVSESAKIPLHNTQLDLKREGLLGLEGMTEEIADAILDWIDGNDEMRELGAEFDYYLSLTEPYQPTNGIPLTVGELLRVKGVTPYLLYGEDVNRDGILNPNENDGDASWPPDNADGILQRGWAPMFTFYSASPNLTPEGEAKLNITGELDEEARSALSTLFGDEFISFLEAYKQENRDMKSVSELIDATVEIDVPVEEEEQEEPRGGREQREQRTRKMTLRSPWTSENVSDYIQDALEQLTTTGDAVLKGRIDVSKAPAAVLMALPEMTEEVADSIASSASQRQAEEESAAWLLTEGIVDVELFQKIEPFITTKGAVYQVESVGFLGESGPVYRVCAIVDGSEEIPQILRIEEYRTQGSGYSRDMLMGIQNY